VLAYTGFPARRRAEPHGTNPLERPNEEALDPSLNPAIARCVASR
jgi:hypothetical protein